MEGGRKKWGFVFDKEDLSQGGWGRACRRAAISFGNLQLTGQHDQTGERNEGDVCGSPFRQVPQLVVWRIDQTGAGDGGQCKKYMCCVWVCVCQSGFKVAASIPLLVTDCVSYPGVTSLQYRHQLFGSKVFGNNVIGGADDKASAECCGVWNAGFHYH